MLVQFWDPPLDYYIHLFLIYSRTHFELSHDLIKFLVVEVSVVLIFEYAPHTLIPVLEYGLWVLPLGVRHDYEELPSLVLLLESPLDFLIDDLNGSDLRSLIVGSLSDIVNDLDVYDVFIGLLSAEVHMFFELEGKNTL